MVILAGVGFILIGVLSLVAGDFWWGWRQFNNELEGQISKRTEAWDAQRIAAGIGLILLGVVLVIVGFRT